MLCTLEMMSGSGRQASQHTHLRYHRFRVHRNHSPRGLERWLNW